MGQVWLGRGGCSDVAQDSWWHAQPGEAVARCWCCSSSARAAVTPLLLPSFYLKQNMVGASPWSW